MYFQIFEEKSENRKDIKKGRKPMQDLSHHAFLIATGMFKFREEYSRIVSKGSM